MRSLGSFDIDEPILAATDVHYADIRIVNDKQTETPFLVRVKRQNKTVSRENMFVLKALAFEEQAENRIEIVLERKADDPVPHAVVVSSRLKNYEKQVSVFGSNDRSTWQPLAVDQPIFDYSRFFDLRNDRVDFRQTAFGFYRVEIANISESHQSPLVRIARERRGTELFSEIEKTSFTRADFRIENLRFVRKITSEVRSEVVTRAYPVQDLVVAEDEDQHETVVTFSSCRAPITKLAFVTPDINFSREVIVEAGSTRPDGKPTWRRVCAGRISRIDLGSFKRNALSVVLPSAQRLETCRLRIKNHDSPPLEVKELRLEGKVMEVVFLKDPGSLYGVLYAGEGVAQPTYDIMDVLRNAETAATDVYTMSLQANNPAYGGPSGGARFNSRGVLIAAVIVMVAALGGILAKAAKRVETPLQS